MPATRAADTGPAIRAIGISKRFGSLQAVDDVRFEVFPGEIFGLVGPDGAGKTTTLRMLASIMDASSGEARIAGFDVHTEAAQVKDHLAYMSQRFGLYPDLTVGENINFYADIYGVGRTDRKEKIAELLAFSHMQPFINRRAGNLSGGMKQKLQLACALIHTPKVLLLDEPTNGVDPTSRRDFWRILHRLLQEKVAILITTAYLDEAERCDRVAFLDHGKIIAQGTPDEVRRLMKGHILTIRSSESRQIHTLLEQEASVITANVFGDTVHLVVPDLEKNRQIAERQLETAGLPVQEIKEARPSLEDVFISLLDSDKRPASQTRPTLQAVAPSPSHDLRQIAVSVDKLTRTFGSFVAVDQISFQVAKGEIFGFLGPNGAGKSTTIRMLCGLLRPSGGTGTVAGYDVIREAEQIKQHIGYMSQKFSLYEDLTVTENIDFYGGIYGLQGARLDRRRDWALDMAGLTHHRDSLTSVLSGGWKQRLALACAILHEPPIIFLDEPTSGVDPLSRRRFWDLIYSMADQGITVFVTTHYMEESEYCNRLALIYGGKMIAMGSPQELKTRAMQGSLLDLRYPDPQRLLEPVRTLSAVRDASLFGAGLHILTSNIDATRAALDTLATELHLESFATQVITPSMEDVFISLIEEVDRNKATDAGEQKK